MSTFGMNIFRNRMNSNNVGSHPVGYHPNVLFRPSAVQFAPCSSHPLCPISSALLQVELSSEEGVIWLSLGPSSHLHFLKSPPPSHFSFRIRIGRQRPTGNYPTFLPHLFLTGIVVTCPVSFCDPFVRSFPRLWLFDSTRRDSSVRFVCLHVLTSSLLSFFAFYPSVHSKRTMYCFSEIIMSA